MIISLDTETTGLDLRHGSRPFLVTMYNSDDVTTWWEWDVDPLTRQPVVPPGDLEEVQQTIDSAEFIVLQNAKFDVAALQSVYHGTLEWDWSKVYDTLLAGHLLASNHPHDLTTMALMYLGVDIKSQDNTVQQACNEARRIARSRYPDWLIARSDDPTMPSAKGSLAKSDMWLPRAVAKVEHYPTNHLWHTVCARYANVDSEVTLHLFNRQRQLLEERGLWDIYLTRLRVLPIAYDMESRGITICRSRLEQLQQEYTEESGQAGRVCVNIATSFGADLRLPKGGNNNSLLSTVFGSMGLEPVKRSKKTGAPSLDKQTIEHYEATLPPRSRELTFVQALRRKRKRDTALQYMEGYIRFWLPLDSDQDTGWYRLHPSLNPTGTDTLRWSSSNPNEQNISKQEGFNLRHCFGPAPGREWWSLDAKNIELRIPAYEAGETEMVDLFERSDEPPYYGSYHMLIFDTLHPDKFAQYGMECKQRYGSTWYQWTKNGNFAVQYGAVEASGTADRAYHIPGAQHRIQERFSKVAALNTKMIEFATQHGYVETMPDLTVDPTRGYPLLCTLSQWGEVLPTVPLNYHVQGTAMWWMMKAMLRCQEYLDTLPGCYMVMQIHDELVFDFPQGKGLQPWRTNMPRIRRIKSLMEESGKDLGIPTPVSLEYHPTTWSEGMVL